MRTLISALVFSILIAGFLPAQIFAGTTVAPVDHGFNLKPGESVTDGTRTVTNNGKKGVLRIRYRGKKTGTGKNIEIS